MQTVFGANIEFSMRTFLFKTQGSSAEEQQQTISCNLHLDPAADVSSTEPDDCSCYSEDECTGKIFVANSEDLQNVNIKSIQYLLILQMRMAKDITEPLYHREKDFFLFLRALLIKMPLMLVQVAAPIFFYPLIKPKIAKLGIF